MNRTRIAWMATPAALALMVSTASAQITDAHVQELIRTLTLPKDFAGKLNPYVRAKYDELWEGLQEVDPHIRLPD